MDNPKPKVISISFKKYYQTVDWVTRLKAVAHQFIMIMQLF
ncbi:hypothetical protein XBJ2_1240022 [Xenorhabdus bovienii str. Jollieti]|uniref:Uncharacterized protein n=1 Tax=Xenorhabdus bovienii (strain SS-2004) TaxID=406818 RepID=D3V221_XENBS|nr:hypothetical protein XBJ1_2245 [Xenorhabdus bovienii SS-2004]CDH27158.1 hypothetical protein XBJ2_1240022 [Xenorhabdus bovienii str. Jollieti]